MRIVASNAGRVLVHGQVYGGAKVTEEGVGDETGQVFGAVRELPLQRAPRNLPVQPHGPAHHSKSG